MFKKPWGFKISGPNEREKWISIETSYLYSPPPLNQSFVLGEG